MSTNSATEERIIKKLQEVDLSIDVDDEVLTPIQEFYHNSKILITGGTGFLGNLLLEKLLRTCSPSKVYLLVRPKKGTEIKERLEKLFADPVFQRMINRRPNFMEQIVAIEGDCLKPNLGLNPDDVRLLTDEVDIVFHVAATVRFDEKLKTAVAINIVATRDLIRIARQMPKLKSFVHVSTAYSNCVNETIEEKLYSTALDYKLLIPMTENMTDDVLESITPGLVGEYPNTYAYTKQIAEDVIKQEAQGLPVAVNRPPIVLSTYKEPIRGWINNVYGPSGVVIGAGVGLMRLLYCDHTCRADLVPADMCVNALIVTGYETGRSYEKAKENGQGYDIPVYNFASSNDCSITWETFMDLSEKYGQYTPTTKAIWYYCFRTVKYYPLYLFLTLLLHTIPGIIVDGILICVGKSPRMFKAYTKIHKFSSVVSFFSHRQWNMQCQNMQKIIGKMGSRDRKIFFCDLKELDWDDFMHTYFPGARLYVLKDPLETLPQAKKMWKKFYWAHQTVKIVLGMCLLRLLWPLFSLITTFCKK